MPKDKATSNKKGSASKMSGGFSEIERHLSEHSKDARRNLKVLRILTDLSSKDFAKITGLSHSAIRSIESGQRDLLLGQAFAISYATGVDTYSLLAGKSLREWGGGAQYIDDSFVAWKKLGRKATPGQEKNAKKQKNNLIDHAARQDGGFLGDNFLSLYLASMVGGAPPEIQYAGLSKE